MIGRVVMEVRAVDLYNHFLEIWSVSGAVSSPRDIVVTVMFLIIVVVMLNDPIRILV